MQSDYIEAGLLDLQIRREDLGGQRTAKICQVG